MELHNIPKWMEQYIPEMTDGGIQTKSELEQYLGEEKTGIERVMRNSVIQTLEVKIALLNNLNKSGALFNDEDMKDMWDKGIAWYKEENSPHRFNKTKTDFKESLQNIKDLKKI